MPRFDLPEHDLYVSSWKLVPRRMGDNAQLGLYGPRVVASCLTQRLPDPLRKGHPLPAGDTLNLFVLFLIQEDL